jgi:hypothetical protein
MQMRIVALILSFIVLALTAVPCIDKHEDDCLQKQEISKDVNHSQHDGLDHCSPFCTCQCCQASFFVPMRTSFAALTTSVNSFRTTSATPENLYIFEFYNPPKTASFYTA